MDGNELAASCLRARKGMKMSMVLEVRCVGGRQAESAASTKSSSGMQQPAFPSIDPSQTTQQPRWQTTQQQQPRRGGSARRLAGTRSQTEGQTGWQRSRGRPREKEAMAARGSGREEVRASLCMILHNELSLSLSDTHSMLPIRYHRPPCSLAATNSLADSFRRGRHHNSSSYTARLGSAVLQPSRRPSRGGHLHSAAAGSLQWHSWLPTASRHG